jgi:hypothetical protein
VIEGGLPVRQKTLAGQSCSGRRFATESFDIVMSRSQRPAQIRNTKHIITRAQRGGQHLAQK